MCRITTGWDFISKMETKMSSNWDRMLELLPFVVPDVSAQDDYIACSITVKAEIVVPIFVNGENIGQIDIDSNTLDPFSETDERFLEFVCEKVSGLLS